jgi:hypothetical protein
MQIIRYSCRIVIKLDFSRQIFEKYINTKFMKIRQWGVELFRADGRTDEQTEDRQTDRHDVANGRFSQFCEHA